MQGKVKNQIKNIYKGSLFVHLINFSNSDIIVVGEFDVQETFIVCKIKVKLQEGDIIPASMFK